MQIAHSDQPVFSLYSAEHDERLKGGIREVGRLAERLGVKSRVPGIPYHPEGSYSFVLLRAADGEPTWELGEIIAAAHALLAALAIAAAHHRQ